MSDAGRSAMTKAEIMVLTDKTLSDLFSNHNFSTERPPTIADYSPNMHTVDGIVEVQSPHGTLKRHFIVLIDSKFRPRVVKVVIDGEALAPCW